MSTSIMIAQILGPMYLVLAAGFWLNTAYYKKAFEGFLNNEGVLYIAGLLVTLAGILILRAQHTLMANWTTVITLIGCIMILKGLMMLVFRQYLEMWKKFIKGNAIMVAKWATLIFGVFLTWMGYWG